MFFIKYVVINPSITDYFECDMKNGIYNDLLLIPTTPFVTRINGRFCKHPAYTAFFFPKETPYFYAPASLPYKDYFIQFTSDKSVTEEYMIPPLQPINLCDPARIFDLIEIIAFENIAGSPNRDEILNNLMKTIFLKICESGTNKNTIPHYNELLNVRRDIFNYPERNMTLEMLADKLHISPNYFHSLYKMAFGRTFMQDIIESRIQHAKYFLAYSNQPVNLIAVNCGYNNTEHFCRQFKKTTGLTPLQYRKNKIHTNGR